MTHYNQDYITQTPPVIDYSEEIAAVKMNPERVRVFADAIGALPMQVVDMESKAHPLDLKGQNLDHGGVLYAAMDKAGILRVTNELGKPMPGEKGTELHVCEAMARAPFYLLDGYYMVIPSLMEWFTKHPDLWGNKNAPFMFSDSKAFGHSDRMILISVIQKHWAGVADRVEAQANA